MWAFWGTFKVQTTMLVLNSEIRDCGCYFGNNQHKVKSSPAGKMAVMCSAIMEAKGKYVSAEEGSSDSVLCMSIVHSLSANSALFGPGVCARHWEFNYDGGISLLWKKQKPDSGGFLRIRTEQFTWCITEDWLILDRERTEQEWSGQNGAGRVFFLLRWMNMFK